MAFTSDLKEDLRRRDFTINAMAYSHETGIVDIFGGMKDLKEGVVRCVGNAVERFTEDALRILRAIRFSAQLNFTINLCRTDRDCSESGQREQREDPGGVDKNTAVGPSRTYTAGGRDGDEPLYIGGFSLGVWDQHRQGEGSL